MSNLEKNKRMSTSVITDLRNFSKTFKDFQNKEDEVFLKFIEDYYSILNNLATTISDEVWMHSIGDGILAIFLDKNDHYKKGYAYILLAHRALKSLCDEFMKENENTKISFGIGADSGGVWSVGKGYLSTYVGTVINRAARIEAITKNFGQATTAIGNSLYKSLLKEFNKEVYDIVEKYNNYDDLINDNVDAVLASKKFLLQYTYDMPLKGIQSNAPIFRLSESLAKNDKLFWSFVKELIGEEKIKKIKLIIK